MLKPNAHYAELKESYLFVNIAQKVKAYSEAHPGERLLRLGPGLGFRLRFDGITADGHQQEDDRQPSEFHDFHSSAFALSSGFLPSFLRGWAFFTYWSSQAPVS